jgi:hypothetical protein
MHIALVNNGEELEFSPSKHWGGINIISVFSTFWEPGSAD